MNQRSGPKNRAPTEVASRASPATLCHQRKAPLWSLLRFDRSDGTAAATWSAMDARIAASSILSGISVTISRSSGEPLEPRSLDVDEGGDRRVVDSVQISIHRYGFRPYPVDVAAEVD